MLTDEERKVLVANKVVRSHYNYMVSALLLTKGLSSHTHSGTIGLFGLHFVKTGIVSTEMGKFFSELFELRQTGDYDDWKVVSEKDVIPLVPTAQVFLDTIEKIIKDSGYLQRP